MDGGIRLHGERSQEEMDGKGTSRRQGKTNIIFSSSSVLLIRWTESKRKFMVLVSIIIEREGVGPSRRTFSLKR